MSLSLKSILGALAVGGSLFASSAAQADTTVSMAGRAPVALTACAIDYRTSAPSAYDYVTTTSVSGVDVSFRNERRIDATEVDLAVGYGGKTTTLTDVGRFSPSTSIAHRFTAFTGQEYANAGSAQCAVVAVHYADGSVWQANVGAPIAQAALK